MESAASSRKHNRSVLSSGKIFEGFHNKAPSTLVCLRHFSFPEFRYCTKQTNSYLGPGNGPRLQSPKKGLDELDEGELERALSPGADYSYLIQLITLKECRERMFGIGPVPSLSWQF